MAVFNVTRPIGGYMSKFQKSRGEGFGGGGPNFTELFGPVKRCGGNMI